MDIPPSISDPILYQHNRPFQTVVTYTHHQWSQHLFKELVPPNLIQSQAYSLLSL